jgi:type II secretory pathway pseudopilin PulG
LTLVEVMLVMAILLILASLALPIMRGPLSNMRLRKAGDVIRTEWTRLRVQAMGDGEIYAFRYTIGSNRYLVEAIDDPHFVDRSGPSSVENGSDGRVSDRNTREDGATVGLDAPETAASGGATLETLPEDVYFADGLVATDPRSGHYVPVEAVETTDDSGATWSAPILFYPDGTTSTALLLLKNARPRCLEVRLRGFTGIAAIGPDVTPERYTGRLDAHAERTDAALSTFSEGADSEGAEW